MSRLALLCLLFVLLLAAPARAADWFPVAVDASTGTVTIGAPLLTANAGDWLVWSIPNAGVTTPGWSHNGTGWVRNDTGDATPVTATLASGTYTIRAGAAIGGSNPVQRDRQTFTVAAPPGQPQVTLPALDAGWVPQLGTGITVVIDSSPGASVTAEIEHAGGTATLPATVADEQGRATWTAPLLGDGPTTIRPSATLEGATTPLAGPAVSFWLDAATTAPVLNRALATVEGPALALTATVEFSRTPADPTVLEWYVDGVKAGTASPAGNGVPIPVSLDLAGQPGEHTLRLVATDEFGHTAEASHTFVVDATPDAAPAPQLAVAGLRDGGFLSDAQPQLTLTADPKAKVTVEIPGRAPVVLDADADGVATHTSAPLGEGAHTITATQTDGLGNVSPATTRTVTLDTTAPALPEGYVLATEGFAEARWDAPAGVTVTCSVDGAAFAPCSSPLGLSHLAPGAHQLRIRHTDAAGLSSLATIDFATRAARVAPPAAAPPPQAPAQVVTPPPFTPTLAPVRIDRVSVKGKRVSWRLSRPATVTLALQRKVGRRWRAVRTRRAVTLANATGYTVKRRFGGVTLAKGTYRVVVSAERASARSGAFSV